MLKKYLERMRKAHPEWVSLFVKKYTADDGTFNAIIKAYQKGGDKFLTEWYAKFHSQFSNAEGDTWFDGFKSWFNDAVTVLGGSTAIATTVNNNLNPDAQAQKTLTESEKYEKREKLIWGFFIGISITILISLAIITLSKRRS